MNIILSLFLSHASHEKSPLNSYFTHNDDPKWKVRQFKDPPLYRFSIMDQYLLNSEQRSMHNVIDLLLPKWFTTGCLYWTWWSWHDQEARNAASFSPVNVTSQAHKPPPAHVYEEQQLGKNYPTIAKRELMSMSELTFELGRWRARWMRPNWKRETICRRFCGRRQWMSIILIVSKTRGDGSNIYWQEYIDGGHNKTH